MSTLDVVAQAGGSNANFLDAGGGSDAAKIKQAVELILSNERVKAVLFNIFGGITRCDEVAKGLIAAFEELEGGGDGGRDLIPFVVRLTAPMTWRDASCSARQRCPRASGGDDERGRGEGRRWRRGRADGQSRRGGGGHRRLFHFRQ